MSSPNIVKVEPSVEYINNTLKMEEPNESQSVGETLANGAGNLEDVQLGMSMPLDNTEGAYVQEKQHKCQYCDRTFTYRRNRLQHERSCILTRTQEGPKVYKCQYCDRSFSKKFSCVGHERLHTGEKPYKCKYCDKAYTRRSTWLQHEKNHAPDKPFKCQYCEKSFGGKSHHERHELTHTGEKPYKCRYCDAGFALKSNVVQHEKIHTGEKAFKCQYCGKSFTAKYSLSIHHRLHTGEKPYKCQYCDKTFNQKYAHKVHELIHTGEKLYKCRYCKNEFAKQANCTRHEALHTDTEKEFYQCVYCEKIFFKKEDCILHQYSCNPKSPILPNTSDNSNESSDVTRHWEEGFSNQTSKLEKRNVNGINKNILENGAGSLVDVQLNHQAQFNQVNKSMEQRYEDDNGDGMTATVKVEPMDDGFENVQILNEGVDPEQLEHNLDHDKTKINSVKVEPVDFFAHTLEYENSDITTHQEIMSKDGPGSVTDIMADCKTNSNQIGEAVEHNMDGADMVDNDVKIESVDNLDSGLTVKMSNKRTVPESVLENGAGTLTDIQLNYQVAADQMKGIHQEMLKCQNCGKIYISDTTTCEKEAPDEDKQYYCQYCRTTLSQDNIPNRMPSEKGYSIQSKRLLVSNDCTGTVTTANESLSHTSADTREKPFKCQYCDARFTINSNCVRHEKIHTGETPYKCHHCDKTFAVKSYCVRHEMSHSGEKPFKCRYCDKTFTLNSNCLQHEKTHTRTRSFKCQYCDKAFYEKKVRRKHERLHTGELPFKCQVCQKAFLTQFLCSRHEIIHTEREKHKCQFCGKSFFKKEDCLRHEEIVHKGSMTEERPYKCQYCDLTFSRKNNCVVHERTHTGEKPFQCQYCDKAFSIKGTLINHERTHTGEAPFKCQFCDKTFKLKGGSRHEIIHTEREKHKCQFCGKSFFKKEDCLRHEEIVHKGSMTEERPYKCQYCDLTFSRKNNCVVHERTHTGEKPFQCQYCDKAFSIKGTLINHERTHTGEAPFKCQFCDKTFKLKGGCVGHEKIHTGERPYQCQYCEMSFPVSHTLKRHVERRHAGQLKKTTTGHQIMNSSRNLDIQGSSMNIEPVQEKYVDFKTSSGITENESMVGPVIPSFDLEAANIKITEENMMSNGAGSLKDIQLGLQISFKNGARGHSPGKPHKCQYCGKSFRDKQTCVGHESIHTGEKPFKCRYCDKTYTLKANCLQHEKTHASDKPFKCQHCEKAFVEKTHLLTHERFHTGEKPYKCQNCEKAFAVKSNLMRHEVIHTGEKPFICQYCDKSFSRKNSCIQHERTHTGEKPYNCKYCERTFAVKGNCSLHERNHTGEKPYKCQFCNKPFKERTDCLRHERIHTGEKPYKCNKCEKSFRLKSQITNHEKTHTGEKPFKCQYCEKRFSWKDSCTKHELLHTTRETYKCQYCEKIFFKKRDYIVHEGTVHSHSLILPNSTDNYKESSNMTRHLEVRLSNHTSKLEKPKKISAIKSILQNGAGSLADVQLNRQTQFAQSEAVEQRFEEDCGDDMATTVKVEPMDDDFENAQTLNEGVDPEQLEHNLGHDKTKINGAKVEPVGYFANSLKHKNSDKTTHQKNMSKNGEIMVNYETFSSQIGYHSTENTEALHTSVKVEPVDPSDHSMTMLISNKNDAQQSVLESGARNLSDMHLNYQMTADQISSKQQGMIKCQNCGKIYIPVGDKIACKHKTPAEEKNFCQYCKLTLAKDWLIDCLLKE
ncbi:zinc finger protein 91 [Lingula anatina]|uniref:Zinc finger protein 91 n=1 Tax=Lingula anatina TaxID=7574 RepID=A0A2R2MMH6_LINAN|nr:zinc finger protein 91 [Lingula anatina]|eukprot:XP_023931428.1 zinc finger protein 91 [Lingula anatina]